MCKSSRQFEVFRKGLPVSEDGPEHLHASSCEGDGGLVVVFSLGPLAVVEGAAVGAYQGCEDGLVEDAPQGLAATLGRFYVFSPTLHEIPQATG